MITNFSNIYNKLQEKTNLDNTAKGQFFEKLINIYLSSEPIYKNQFSKVLTYKKFQEITGGGGIKT
jgi:predicted helicase